MQSELHSSEDSVIAISLKKQIRNVTIFQVIIPTSGLFWVLGTQASQFLDDEDDKLLSRIPDAQTVYSLSSLTEPILIVSYGLFLLAKIGTALLLCQGTAKRDSCKLIPWVILETLLTCLGVSICVFIIYLDSQKCSLSHISLVTSMTTVVSMYAIVIVIIYLRRNKFEMSTRDYDDCVSLRYEPRRTRNCNLSKSTQTL